jgi:hypothetical protein
MPARNPEAVRQRAIAAARQRSGQPTIPGPDPAFVALLAATASAPSAKVQKLPKPGTLARSF